MSKNSLSSLVGQYLSDSDSRDEVEHPENSKEHDVITTTNGNQNIPTTSWTKCMDPNTGHPYYWNVDTKEVTWEKPQEYEEYLKQIAEMNPSQVDDCWILGYSDGQSPYYVNEYTREVSWVKPEGFKGHVVRTHENEVSRTKKLKVTKKSKTNSKKSQPKHLDSPSDDERIELITSYSLSSNSSSGEEGKIRVKGKKNEEYKKKTTPNLVAAYTTDDSDSGDIEKQEGHSNTKVQASTNQLKGEEITATEVTEVVKESIEKSTVPNLQVNSFSSIITGGIIESSIDEEIKKLKQELEKELNCLENEKKEKYTEPYREEFDEKTFQRKKRIEFKKAGIVNSDAEPRPGLGFSEKDVKHDSVDIDKKKNLYSNFQKGHVEFLKSNNEEIPKSSEISKVDDGKNIESKALHVEIKDLSDLIAGKIKFLTVGHPEVSAVQVMNIQMETLLAAFRSSALKPEYFFNWLKCNSDELMSLEQNAVPAGWRCIWDRESSQYCYKNLSTGDVQWEFPADSIESSNEQLSTHKVEDEVVKGEDEMDISTTPPPNENEEIKVENEVTLWNESNPPPPPVISMQPPPPSSIDMNCELASFYSDIANLQGNASTQDNDRDTQNSSPSVADNNTRKRILDEQNLRKRRKKIKVHGLGLKMKEVSDMVANWQKAQKELDN